MVIDFLKKLSPQGKIAKSSCLYLINILNLYIPLLIYWSTIDWLLVIDFFKKFIQGKIAKSSCLHLINILNLYIPLSLIYWSTIDWLLVIDFLKTHSLKVKLPTQVVSTYWTFVKFYTRLRHRRYFDAICMNFPRYLWLRLWRGM